MLDDIGPAGLGLLLNFFLCPVVVLLHVHEDGADTVEPGGDKGGRVEESGDDTHTGCRQQPSLDLPHRVDLLGHSMGGMVVLRAILKAPERFRSLILMDTAPHGLKLFEPEMRARIVEMVREGGCQVLVAGMKGQPQPPSIKRGIDFLGENEHWRRIQVKLEQMDPEAFADLGDELADQASVVESLTSISVPTSVIVGEDDKPFMAPSRLMASTIDDARLDVIDKAAHSPQYENPEAWRAAADAH